MLDNLCKEIFFQFFIKKDNDLDLNVVCLANLNERETSIFTIGN